MMAASDVEVKTASVGIPLSDSALKMLGFTARI